MTTGEDEGCEMAEFRGLGRFTPLKLPEQTYHLDGGCRVAASRRKRPLPRQQQWVVPALRLDLMYGCDKGPC